MCKVVITLLAILILPLHISFAASPDNCIAIDRVEISGSTQLTPAQIATIVESIDLSCVTPDQIKQLVKSIKTEYSAIQIPLVKVNLPEQNIKESRKLILQIAEPIIDEIAFAKDSPGTRSQIYFSFPTSKDKILNFADLKQGISQFNRLDSIKTKVALNQTDKLNNKYLVELNETKQFPITVDIHYDNQGSPSSGLYRKAIELKYDNLLNINDKLDVIYRKNSISGHQTKLTETYYGKYDVPFGYWNFSPSVERTATSYLLKLTYYSYPIKSLSDSASFNFRRALWAGDDYRLSFVGYLDAKETSTYLSSYRLENYNLSTLAYGLEYVKNFSSTAYVINAKLANGIRAFEASKDTPYNHRKAENLRLKLNSSLISNFDLADYKLQYDGSLTGQYSFNNLYDADKIYLGSLDSVRGFVGNVINGNSGFYVQQNLAYAPEFLKIDHDITNKLLGTQYAYVGFDFGGVRNHNIATRQKTYQGLSGVSLGLKNKDSRLGYNIQYSKPLTFPDSVTKKSHQIYFDFSLKLI